MKANRYERLLAEAGPEAEGWSKALARAARRARRHVPAQTVEQEALRDVAAGVAGPILVSYVAWLLIEARRRGIERLYFLSRDGQVLQALADILAPLLGLDGIERRYLHASRQAWNRAMPGGRPERWLWNDLAPGATIADLLRRLGIPPDEVAEDLAGAGFADLDAPLDVAAIAPLKRHLASERFAAAAEAAQEANRRLLVAYLEQEGLFDPVPKATVDLGWTGSQHETLCDLLRARNCPPCPCFLFGAKALDSSWAEWRHGFYFDEGRAGTGLPIPESHTLPARDLYVLMEMFCTSEDGTLAGFRECHGRVEPELAAGQEAEMRAWGLPLLRRTLAEVAAGIPRKAVRRVTPAALQGLGGTIDRLLETFWTAPSPDEARIWGAFPWEAGQGHESGAIPLAEPFALADASAAWQPAGLKKRDIFWVEGAIAMSSPSVAVTVRGLRLLRRTMRKVKRAPERLLLARLRG